MATTTRRALALADGCLSCSRWGGMLGPVLFLLPNGRQVSPLYVAPWGNDPQRETLPEILRELRGEWPCVPFGSDSNRRLSAGRSATGAKVPLHDETDDLLQLAGIDGNLALHYRREISRGSPGRGAFPEPLALVQQ